MFHVQFSMIYIFQIKISNTPMHNAKGKRRHQNTQRYDNTKTDNKYYPLKHTEHMNGIWRFNDENSDGF